MKELVISVYGETTHNANDYVIFRPIVRVRPEASQLEFWRAKQNKAKQKQDESHVLEAESVAASKCESHVLFKAMRKTKHNKKSWQDNLNLTK